MKQYEWNARTRVSMWYDNTSTNQRKMHGYANKFWSGLLRYYYLPRASMYFKCMLGSLRESQKFQVEKWRRDRISYSNRWQASADVNPVLAVGDSLTICKALFKKYWNV